MSSTTLEHPSTRHFIHHSSSLLGPAPYCIRDEWGRDFHDKCFCPLFFSRPCVHLQASSLHFSHLLDLAQGIIVETFVCRSWCKRHRRNAMHDPPRFEKKRRITRSLVILQPFLSEAPFLSPKQGNRVNCFHRLDMTSCFPLSSQ